MFCSTPSILAVWASAGSAANENERRPPCWQARQMCEAGQAWKNSPGQAWFDAAGCVGGIQGMDGVSGCRSGATSHAVRHRRSRTAGPWRMQSPLAEKQVPSPAQQLMPGLTSTADGRSTRADLNEAYGLVACDGLSDARGHQSCPALLKHASDAGDVRARVEGGCDREASRFQIRDIKLCHSDPDSVGLPRQLRSQARSPQVWNRPGP